MTAAFRPRILIVGGTGVFGQRLVQHLATFTGIELFLSSRSEKKACALAQRIRSKHPSSVITGIRVDHRDNFAATLAKVRPFIVIDCSGPFQVASFEIARLSLEAGAHHIDLADATEYLNNYKPQLNELAVRNNRIGLTGASSTPTLSACVVRELTRNWKRVDSIDISITPGGKSEVGQSVIEAIMSYAGKEITTWQQGELGMTTGWLKSRVVTIPGLGKRRVAPVETLDAEYLGPLHEVCSRVSFSAGLESSLEQWGLQAIAYLRRWGLFPHPKHVIPMLLKLRKLTRIFTSVSGGMLVEVRGINSDGIFTQSKWSLLAKQDHGPYVPILPAAAAVKKLLGADLSSGAFFANEKLMLEDILDEMEPFDIKTDIQVLSGASGIFESEIGVERSSSLPKCLQNFHKMTGFPVWSGNAEVAAPNWIGPKLIARLFGFPIGGQNIPVTVSVDRMLLKDGIQCEHWTRNFGGNIFSSFLCRKPSGPLTERFGIFVFTLDLTTDQSGLQMSVGNWRLGILHLPKFLAPISDAREYQDASGKFCFDISLKLPVLGLLTRYRGCLEPSPLGNAD
jgi:saccharopine dehydrogenase-like NADP-dependent oxidoreductase